MVIEKKSATVDAPTLDVGSIWNDVANSFLHRILTHPKIFPYTDMVRCIIDHIDIIDRDFITPKKTIIGSFKAEDLRKMYHLRLSQRKYDTQFIHKLMHENLNPTDLIREWRRDPSKHKLEDTGMYSLAPIVGPFSHVTAMMCHLYGYPNTHKFSQEWVPLIQVVSDGYIMDWENILSNNLTTQIHSYRQKHNVNDRNPPPFFMSAYVTDYICFSYDFPSTGWKWTIQ